MKAIIRLVVAAMDDFFDSLSESWKIFEKGCPLRGEPGEYDG
jgi:hypothetical protein